MYQPPSSLLRHVKYKRTGHNENSEQKLAKPEVTESILKMTRSLTRELWVRVESQSILHGLVHYGLNESFYESESSWIESIIFCNAVRIATVRMLKGEKNKYTRLRMFIFFQFYDVTF